MNADLPHLRCRPQGHGGQALCRALQSQGLPDPITFTSAELDLRNQAAVRAMMERERPTHVFVAAAKVGGIHANNMSCGRNSCTTTS